jgi:hypothetical protein
MAFSYASERYTIAGTLKVEIIEFNAAAVTTGVVSSKISNIAAVIIANTTSGVVAGQKAIWTGQNITLSGVNANDVGDLIVIGI